MRLGLRDPYEVQCAHGMADMTHREEIFARHPDWFALYGGKRQIQKGRVNNHLCYSNQELFEETVRNVRLQFDHFKMDMVSVMPPDGYVAICQCPLCEGKNSPERDQRGLASDYIWDFVNRVAREVGKTLPERKVLNCAHDIYTLPPLRIEKLEPHVMGSIVGARRAVNNRAEEQEEYRKLRESWLSKTSNPIINFEYYPFTDRGWYLPSFAAHTLGASINALNGLSLGEDIWLSLRQDFEKTGMGINPFLVYFTQRMYWGGKAQDVDALFREYCRLFYGPAEHELFTFLRTARRTGKPWRKIRLRPTRRSSCLKKRRARWRPRVLMANGLHSWTTSSRAFATRAPSLAENAGLCLCSDSWVKRVTTFRSMENSAKTHG